MKQRRSVSQLFLVRLCCWLLLPVLMAGCENKGNVSSTDNRSSSSSGSRVEDNGGASPQTRRRYLLRVLTKASRDNKKAVGLCVNPRA
jgi:hypothetical protein